MVGGPGGSRSRLPFRAARRRYASQARAAAKARVSSVLSIRRATEGEDVVEDERAQRHISTFLVILRQRETRSRNASDSAYQDLNVYGRVCKLMECAKESDSVVTRQVMTSDAIAQSNSSL